MEKEMFSIPFNQNVRESYNTSFFSNDLPTMIDNMRHEQIVEKGELSSRILLQSPAKTIILTLLNEGTEVSSFQANDSITFQVIEGKLKLHIRKGSVAINKGELLILNEKTKYSFSSTEETVFLLTLAS